MREELRYLKSYRQMSYREFVSNFEHFKTAERCFEVAIQACIDVAVHLIGLFDFRKPDRYESVFMILAEERIFPEAFARNLMKMVGFRNILVHEYLRIRLDIVHKAIQEDLSDLERFEEYVLEFLEPGPEAKSTPYTPNAQSTP